MRQNFHELPIDQLDSAEWEALCDGCGLCCLIKLRDSSPFQKGPGEVMYTDVACQLLDTQSACCSDYANRFETVPDCLKLDMELLKKVDWLPASCAYRLRLEDKPLRDWHPLISGDPDSVRAAGIGAAGRCVSETQVTDDEIDERVVRWIDF
jgi:uncharacterized cysteine cluster protein YcgN (CxxCxxCC family)